MSKKLKRKKEKATFRKSKSKITDWKLFKRLLPYMLTKKNLLILSILISISGTAVSLIMPLLYGVAFDSHIANRNFQQILYLGLIMLVLKIIQGSGYFLETWWAGIIREEAIYNLRQDMFKKMQAMDLRYFDVTPTGDTIAHITSDINSLGEVISGQIANILILIVYLVVEIVIMININLILTLALIFFIGPIILVILYEKKVARVRHKNFRESNSKLTSTMTENILGVKVSRNFARTESNREEFEKHNKENMIDAYNMMKSLGFRNSWKETYQSITYVVIIVISGILLMNEGSLLSEGIVFLFLMYINSFYSPIMQIIMYLGALQTAYASFERVSDFLDFPTEIQEKSEALPLKIQGGSISFENVTFRYSSDAPDVLTNFSLNVKARETLAIVGETGSGKSTIFNILSRLYPLPEGKICIDKQDIKNVSIQSLRRNIGVILQEPYLFEGTIKENLSLSIDPSMGQIEKILHITGAKFINKLQNELESIIGATGVRISQGEKQLLSFARAIIDDPPILLMDEATSSIDPQSEITLQKSLNNILKQRTTIIIAHRLSTVKNVDRIIVLDQGKIIEEGTFQALLDKRGTFYKLYSMQFINQENDLGLVEASVS